MLPATSRDRSTTRMPSSGAGAVGSNVMRGIMVLLSWAGHCPVRLPSGARAATGACPRRRCVWLLRWLQLAADRAGRMVLGMHVHIHQAVGELFFLLRGQFRGCMDRAF